MPGCRSRPLLDEFSVALEHAQGWCCWGPKSDLMTMPLEVRILSFFDERYSELVWYCLDFGFCSVKRGHIHISINCRIALSVVPSGLLLLHDFHANFF